MLKLDHIPFVGSSGQVLRAAFNSLGFQCSPNGIYTSPEYPKTEWRTVCVFMERGWLDLLQDDRDGVSEIGKPSGCLYLTDDLSGSSEKFDQEHVTASYSLTRTWVDRESESEAFKIASVKNSVCQLPLAIIQHRWPCDDVEPQWTNHPNTAISLEAVCCCSDRGSTPITYVVDPSQAFDLVPNRFAERFSTNRHEYAVSIRVKSIETTLSLLAKNAVLRTQLDNRVIAYPERLACAFEFAE